MTDDTLPEGAVRALEWEPDGPDELAADFYTIRFDGYVLWLYKAQAKIGRHPDTDTAKAAAQTDYERRILSALTPDALAALRPSVPDEPREPGEWDDCGDGCYVMQLLPENGKPGISFEALADGRFVYNVFGDDGSSLRRAVIPALPDPSARIAELEAALRDVIDAYDYTIQDEYDRGWSGVSDAVQDARAALAKETDDAE